MQNNEYYKILYNDVDLDSIAVIDNEKTIDYKSLFALIEKLCVILQQMGISPNDRICLLLSNSIEFIISYYSLNKLGAIVVPIDYNAKLDVIEYIIGNSGATFLITDLSKPIDLSYNNIKAHEIKKDIDKYELNIIPLIHSKNIDTPNIDSDTNLIIFTTGTTGFKKGVILTNNAIINATNAIKAMMKIPEKPTEIIAMPLSRSFGLARMRCVFSNGGTIVLSKGLLNPAFFIKQIIDLKVIGFGLVPAGIRILTSKFSSYLNKLGSQIQYIELGSSEFDPDEKTNLQKLMPNTNIFMHYGLTEASRSTFLNFKNSDKIHTIGKPLPGVKIAICDNDFNFLDTNECGRILINSEWMTSGYFGEDLNSCFFKQWLITDDIGKIDNDGYIYFISRESDIINFLGYKFSPIEIERVINNSGLVNESCVILAQNPNPHIVAFIIINERNLTLSKNLKEICAQKLESYKIPSDFIVCEKIEKTDSGKIKRKMMNEKYFGKSN